MMTNISDVLTLRKLSSAFFSMQRKGYSVFHSAILHNSGLVINKLFHGVLCRYIPLKGMLSMLRKQKSYPATVVLTGCHDIMGFAIRFNL